MKKQLLKSVLAVLLCAALVLPGFPLDTFAAKLDNFNTGSDFSGVKLSVIGDSISTFYGVTNSATYNPLYLSTSEATFGTYYGNTSHSSYAEFSSVTRYLVAADGGYAGHGLTGQQRLVRKLYFVGSGAG